MKYALLATGCTKNNASFVRLRELGRELARQGFDVDFVLDGSAHNSSLVQDLQPARLQLVSGTFRATRLFNRRTLLRRLAPDIVHILNPQPLNVSSVFGLGVPIVCDWDELLSARQRPWLRKSNDWFFEACARRIATTHVVASRYLQHLFRARFGVESLYLPYATYLPDAAVASNPFSKPTAVYLGNLIRDFDHDIVIDAWELLLRRGVPLDLSIIGGGELLDSVRRDVERRGLTNVRVEGYMTGQPMWDRLRHAHVLLFPIRDTVGNRSRCPSKTYAYMQARRPIITNRVGEVAEVLGDLAEYVAPSPVEFASAVERIAFTHPPDVDYPVRLHTWADRVSRLVAGLRERGMLCNAGTRAE